MSEENERACKESVREICEVMIKRAERGTDAVKEAMRTDSDEKYQDVLMAVKALWLEEQAVAVLNS